MSAKPEPWRDIVSIIKELREDVRRLKNKPTFYGTGLEVIDDGQIIQDGAVTIPANGLLLVDGGDVIMLDDNMTEIFRLGVRAFGDRGVTVRRSDGSVAWEIGQIFDSNPTQNFMIRDRGGRVIAGDAELSLSGFDAPHLEHRFIPVDYTSSATAQTTSSAAFVATHEHRGFRQNPAMKMQVMVRCSDGATSAEVQVWDVLNGQYLSGFLGAPAVHTIAVPVGTTAFSLFEFSSALNLPGFMSDPIQLEIHARVTGGTGSVSVAPVRTVGGGF